MWPVEQLAYERAREREREREAGRGRGRRERERYMGVVKNGTRVVDGRLALADEATPAPPCRLKGVREQSTPSPPPTRENTGGVCLSLASTGPSPSSGPLLYVQFFPWREVSFGANGTPSQASPKTCAQQEQCTRAMVTCQPPLCFGHAFCCASTHPSGRACQGEKKRIFTFWKGS